MHWSTSTLVLSLLALTTTHSVTACSCFPGPLTIESSLVANPYAVRTFALDTAASTSLDENDPNGDIFIPSYVFQVHKGCNVKDLLWIRTAKTSAMCGVTLDPFSPYLLFGSIADEEVPGYGVQPVLRISLCNAHTKTSQISFSDRMTLQQMESPSCSVRCETTTDCDRFNGEYCAAGECLASGECQTDDDCYNPFNLLVGPIIQCYATRTCDVTSGTCSLECCDQTTPCFADPCQVTECDEDFVTCAADYCSGSCRARFFAANGDLVCQ